MDAIDPVVLLFVGFIAILAIGYLILKRVGRVDYDSYTKGTDSEESSADEKIPE